VVLLSISSNKKVSNKYDLIFYVGSLLFGLFLGYAATITSPFQAKIINLIEERVSVETMLSCLKLSFFLQGIFLCCFGRIDETMNFRKKIYNLIYISSRASNTFIVSTFIFIFGLGYVALQTEYTQSGINIVSSVIYIFTTVTYFKFFFNKMLNECNHNKCGERMVGVILVVGVLLPDIIKSIFYYM
jgi:hypothetical protein